QLAREASLREDRSAAAGLHRLDLLVVDEADRAHPRRERVGGEVCEGVERLGEAQIHDHELRLPRRRLERGGIRGPLYLEPDPRPVGEEWALFFAGFELGASGNGAAVGAATAGAPSAPVIGVFDLVHSYRELGHLVADLNPLAPKPAGHPLLEPSEFGFGDEDLDRVVSCGGFRGCSRTSIRDLIARLQATYCGTLGVEYMHIQDQEQRV